MAGFLHDLNWSLREGKLHELLLKDPLTLATWGLVLVTLLLVIDSWRKGKQQRDRWQLEDAQHRQDKDEERARWKRDDEIRREGYKPKFRFGLALAYKGNASYPEIWCANLGLNSFVIGRVFLQRINLQDEANREMFSPNIIVKAGEMVRFPISPELYKDFSITVDTELSISVSSSEFEINSEPIAFNFFSADKGTVDKVSDGFRERHRVSCSKCGCIGLLDVTGISSKTQLVELAKRTTSEISATCPNHSADSLVSIVHLDGKVTRFKSDAGGK